MQLETKRNQQITKLNLVDAEEKLNVLLKHLDKKHKPSISENITEDEAHKFDGISYELKTLSSENLTKSNLVANLVTRLSELIISTENDDVNDTTTTTSTTTTSTTVKSLIPERDFYFKTGHTTKVKEVEETKEEVVKRPKGFQRKIKPEDE